MGDDPQVIVAGAGPVGLTLAIALGRRGVQVLVAERNAAPGRLPKMERCSARTIELFRRLGLADRVRAAGLPGHVPMDVYITTRLVDEPILRLPYPRPTSIASASAARATAPSHSSPTSSSRSTRSSRCCARSPRSTRTAQQFGCELVGFAHDDDGVTARLRAAAGAEQTLRAAFMVGCDGGASGVRKALGIRLEGRGGIGSLRQVLFRCDELVERVPITGRGRHFSFADADPRIIGTTMVVQSDQRHFTFHTGLPEGSDFAQVIRERIGAPVDLEVLSVNDWKLHPLLAERYRGARAPRRRRRAPRHSTRRARYGHRDRGRRRPRVEARGHARRLGRPGGPRGVRGRAPAGRRRRALRASEYAARGTAEWRKASTAAVVEDSEEGRRVRAAVARQADVHHRKSHEMRGIEQGYRYCRSPLVVMPPDDDDGFSHAYVPSAAPGHRLPHVWCDDGVALHDRLGDATRSCASPRPARTRPRSRPRCATTARPFAVLVREDRRLREVYGADLLLVRPDLHVAWRGDHAPADPVALAAAVTGRQAVLR